MSSQRNNQSSLQPVTSLRIASWNAAGLRNKLSDLKAFISQHKIDIMIVTETHLVNTDNIKINGFYEYIANHPSGRRRGGAAIFIKTSIKHIALNIDTPPKVQCSIIAVALSNGSTINIAAAYFLPTESWSADDFQHLLSRMGERFLIAGDWNAKNPWWGNSRSCARGRALLQCVQSNNYNIIATGSPTHYPTNRRHSPSAIDFGVYKGLRSEQLSIRTLNDLCSDHLPLLFEIYSNPQLRESNCYLLPLNASISRFQLYLKNYILLDTEINSGADIDDCTQIFENNLNLAAKYATPCLRSKQLANNYLRLDHHTLTLIKDRRIIIRLLRRWPSYHMPILKQTLHYLSNQIKQSIKQAEQNRLNRLLESLEPDNRFNIQKLWRITSNIKRQPTPNLAVRKHEITNPNDCWCKTSEEKAEAFSQHLQSRFTPIITTSDSDLLDIESNIVPISESNELPFRCITIAEIQEQIKSLQNKKSPGPDKIDNRTLKALPLIAIEYLALLFNSMLKFGHFPSRWKHAVIKMLHKPGKPSAQLSSYRPISLLSGISKIFETLLLRRLFENDSFAKAIPSHQFGFRKQHGAEQQLGRVTQFLLKAFENRQYCSAVYLDIQEAFDRVWHKGLFYKLGRILPEALYRIICSYLTNRTFVVQCSDGATSSTKNVSAGVPQGSVLGPILYTVYSSDIPAPQYPATSIVATYADDTAVISTSLEHSVAIQRVENYLKTYMVWAKKWCITVNVSKTAHVMHSLRQVTPGTDTLSPKLNGATINNKPNHTYLGIKLDTKLTLLHNTNALVIKIRARAKKLNWLLTHENKLPIKTRALVYKQLIAPIWQYSLPIWGSLVSDRQLARVQVVQNKSLRLITGASWYVTNEAIHAELNVNTVKDSFTTMSARYADRLRYHSNPEARNMALNPYRPERLARPRLYEMVRRCFPVQQAAPRIPSSSSSEDDNSHAELIARHAQRMANLPFFTRSAAYRRYWQTGTTDELPSDPSTNISPAAMTNIASNNQNTIPPPEERTDINEIPEPVDRSTESQVINNVIGITIEVPTTASPQIINRSLAERRHLQTNIMDESRSDSRNNASINSAAMTNIASNNQITPPPPIERSVTNDTPLPVDRTTESRAITNVVDITTETPTRTRAPPQFFTRSLAYRRYWQTGIMDDPRNALRNIARLNSAAMGNIVSNSQSPIPPLEERNTNSDSAAAGVSPIDSELPENTSNVIDIIDLT